MSIVINSSDSPEEMEAKFAGVARMVSDFNLAQERLTWERHLGRHRWRLLVNQPHPDTGLPTYEGCERCGKPRRREEQKVDGPHEHEWERGAHMAHAFGVDGRMYACAICGVYKTPLYREASFKDWATFSQSWTSAPARPMPTADDDDEPVNFTVGTLAKVLGDWAKWRHDECHESPCEHDRELARVLLDHVEEG
jgi:hypothetical protein